MITVEEFITQTNRAKTSEDVFDILKATLAQYGYDRICYTLATDHPHFGLKAGHGILRNYPEDWMKYYTEQNYYGCDPVPKTCFRENKLFLWSDMIAKGGWSERVINMMQEARDATLYDGLCVPFHGPHASVAGLGVASSHGKIEMDDDQKSFITAIATQFHLAFGEREATKSQAVHILLTAREQEILTWAAEGKSDHVIADLMNISYATVRFHMGNVFKKLDANERTYAVVKAIRHGLIHPSKAS